jgi:predicted phosphodiesterase
MTDLSKRLAAVENQAEFEDAVKKRKMPSGWEPGVVWDGTKGTITTDTIIDDTITDGSNLDWSDLLASRGLDPNKYEIVGDTIRWTSYDGWKRDENGDSYSTICYSYKADIRLKHPNRPNLDEIYQSIKKSKKPSKEAPSGDTTFVIALSDWQTGNRDGGGVEKQVQEIADLPEKLTKRIKDLRKTGVQIDHIVIAGLGDLVEGTCGHYPAQQFRIEVDRRDQMKIVRRGIRDIIVALAPLAQKMTVTAVGGNHGENRGLNGKAFTTTGDNDDVAIFEQLAEAFSMNQEAFPNISWRIPLERLTTSLEVNGKILAFTHGHLSKAGNNAAQAVWNWWKDQAHGRAHPGVADADILVTGHYHHFNAKEQEGRALFVCPSIVPVGEYFQDAYGVKTRAGTLTFCISEDGWSELSII